MSYIVLARRLRPQTLDDVIGQPLVTQAIKNALESNTLHPVYLLTGTRGVGKTTIARIIAKSLNCENGPTPCLKCDSCLMIQDGRYPDMYEIDAASRTKVEDTREILDQVQYMPQTGKKKVYLIDEVHMLSQHSFNALLKTLEEPPEHVQFVLATTEPEKIPKTILSRCLHFNLQPLSLPQIQEHIHNILSNDGIKYDTQATELIAEAADGSMRDALSLLDQCLAISPKHISESVTSSLLSTIPSAQVELLLKAVHARDIDEIESICNTLENNNIDFRTLLKQVSEKLINISIDQLRGKTSELTQLWPESYVQVLYRMLMQGMSDLEYSPSVKLGALMCLIRMAAFSPSNAKAPSPSPVTSTIPQTTKQPAVTSTQSKPSEDTQPIPSEWSEIVPKLGLSPMLKNLADHTTLADQTDTAWVLNLDSSHKHLLSDQGIKKLEEKIIAFLGTSIKLTIELCDKQSHTPAAIQEAQTNQNNDKARAELNNDPVLSQLLSEFNVSQEDVEVSAD